MEAQALRQQLESLEQRGIRSFDAPACTCVSTLLDRGEELGGAVGERLILRAQAHLTALSERFATRSKQQEERLTQLEEKVGERPELRSLLAAGHVTRVGRTLRRLKRSATVARPLRAPVRSSDHETPNAGARRRRQTVEYEDSLAELVASLALARATDVVPQDAGPYNPLRIASEVLDRLRAISPFYLTVQLNRIEELAGLLSLPELPIVQEDKPAPPRPTKRPSKAPPGKASTSKAPPSKTSPKKASVAPGPARSPSAKASKPPKAGRN